MRWNKPVVRVPRAFLALAAALAAGAALAVPATAASTVDPAASTADAAGSSADWPGWTHDLAGSRFAAAETQLTPATVGGLRLKWAGASPHGPHRLAKSQPAVVGGVAYVGTPDGKVHALNAQTGATIWTFDVNTVAPGVGDTAVWDGPVVADHKVMFGDHRAYLYALDQKTGSLLWATKVDSHPLAAFTGSPLFYAGKLYIGMSSEESAQGNDYACCTFRGQLAAVDATTGAVVWRYYTVPPATAVGTWPNGLTMYAPSGGPIWGTPAIDSATGTVYFGTGQNYTGVGPDHNQAAGDIDSFVAVNAANGSVRWKRQLTAPDTYRLTCSSGDPGFCPGLLNDTARDWDVASAPNVFTVGGRRVVGVGQKNGVYHLFDAATGGILWERTLGVALPGGPGGVQWGTAYDGKRLYVATWQADPGTLFALDPATGKTIWSTPNPSDGCSTGGAAQFPAECKLAFTPAVTASPGVVYEGSWDGKMRAFSAATGAVLWQFDTFQHFAGVNGITGTGSAVSGNGGAVVSGGMVYVQSGYFPYPVDTGYVLLAFGL